MDGGTRMSANAIPGKDGEKAGNAGYSEQRSPVKFCRLRGNWHRPECSGLAKKYYYDDVF